MCHALGELRARQVVEHPPGQAGAAVSSVDSYLPDHQGLRLIWAPVAADEAAELMRRSQLRLSCVEPR